MKCPKLLSLPSIALEGKEITICLSFSEVWLQSKDNQFLFFILLIYKIPSRRMPAPRSEMHCSWASSAEVAYCLQWHQWNKNFGKASLCISIWWPEMLLSAYLKSSPRSCEVKRNISEYKCLWKAYPVFSGRFMSGCSRCPIREVDLLPCSL